jgi:flavin reductase (DIM6/NTAB) family NADH-FMN oxidoreductase RutF
MSMLLGPPVPIDTNGIDPNAFKGAMAAMPSAVTVITTFASDGTPAGATLSAVTSLSMTPALMLACFDQHSDTLKAVRATGRFLIHVLADGQQELALAFAKKGNDKFLGLSWAKGPLGLPRFGGSAVTIACRLHDTIPGGDHAIVIGEITEIDIDSARPPLVYAERKLIPLPTEREDA